MGDRHEPRSPLAWQGTLGEMEAHGTLLAQTCNGPSCRPVSLAAGRTFSRQTLFAVEVWPLFPLSAGKT